MFYLDGIRNREPVGFGIENLTESESQHPMESESIDSESYPVGIGIVNWTESESRVRTGPGKKFLRPGMSSENPGNLLN